jgi:hypothetical protein
MSESLNWAAVSRGSALRLGHGRSFHSRSTKDLVVVDDVNHGSWLLLPADVEIQNVVTWKGEKKNSSSSFLFFTVKNSFTLQFNRLFSSSLYLKTM